MNKLVFKKVIAQNFRSVSNMPLELDLNVSSKTMVCSNDNGDGKSTMSVYAVYFALFDKSYRGDNKPSLVNSSNGKNCLVELHFETKGSEYVVKRGIKPNVFEIYKDGDLLPIPSSGYQSVLDEILGFDERAFVNQVVLGKEKFKPFTTMSTTDRRIHGEQMMNWTVFNQMDKVTKSRLKLVEVDKRNIEYELNTKQNELKSSENSIRLLEDVIEKQKKSHDEAIINLKTEIIKLKEDFDSVRNESESITHETDKYQTMLHDLQAKSRNEQSKKNENLSKIEKYEKLTECPTCSQLVTDELKSVVLEQPKQELVLIEETLTKLNIAIEKVKVKVDEERTKLNEYNALVSKGNSIKSIIESKVREVKKLSEKTDDEQYVKNLENEVVKKKQIEVDIKESTSKLDNVNKQVAEYKQLIEMLKDDGVKAYMFREYLPLINSKLNNYLSKMNLFVNVSMTESFDIEMNSPERKGQSLKSLSSGQLNRIDLALLFVWRDIAKTLSSVDTNLLVLDEVLESMSEQGVADFMEFYDNEFGNSNTNLFVITQRNNEFSEYFDRIIRYRLENGFTKIEMSS